MPDRTAVDDKLNPSCACRGCDGSCEEYESLMDRLSDPPVPPPRALVALSEDRRVMATLNPAGTLWVVARWRDDWAYWARQYPSIPDTGQDAADVLRAFLRERES